MEQQRLEDYLSRFKGAEASYPFGPEVLVFKVMGKMFALLGEHQGMPRVTLKCQPADGELLVSQFDGITPGYYMNKRHWITVSLRSDVGEAMALDLVDKSYQLVVSKLRKADREELAGKLTTYKE
ncbi:MmcQ/YjbR family DNA-binding protein [uncultured Photobacterium sp.]|uniref:MmcQ/YjbR family DNA-binding protein n=1 Tax=uncultured Photobacterium sp. TaxID=173973 RepID=UPI00261AE82B|nr:MmcQ/YjbR family DNA-binding protein [uncultured Photobacterium sp.]